MNMSQASCRLIDRLRVPVVIQLVRKQVQENMCHVYFHRLECCDFPRLRVE